MQVAGVEISFPEASGELSRTVSSGSRACFEEVRLPSGEPFEFAVPGERSFLALHDIVLDDGELRVGGGPPVRGGDLRSTLTYIPAGVQTQGWSRPTARRQSFTAIHFDSGDLPGGLVAQGALEEPSTYFRSRELERVLVRLRRSLHQPEPFAEVLRETLFDLAMVELVTQLTASAPDAGAERGLSAEQVRRVREYMSEHLAAALSLSELAGVLGLSKFHFSRSYRRATGRSPYSDLLHIRVARARAWMEGGATLSEAAQRAGFSSGRALSDAHLRITGRRIAATSP